MPSKARKKKLIEFSPKQKEYFVNSTHRYNFKVGAVRSGKSYGDIAYVILSRVRAVHGLSGLNVILGVSKATIERNVLQPMRELYGAKIVGTINSQNIVKIAGESVYCLGAEKISQVAKIQGASIKYCYGDEIAKWSKDVFDILPSRLDKVYSQMDGACNPESPMHWLKTFLDRDDIDIYIQHYTIFDNPFLPKSFVDNLCIEYEGTVYYKRFILGLWALAEGLIYPSFEDAFISELNDLQSDPSEYCLSIDYGTENAFVVLKWAKYGNIWVCIDVYYHSGRDTGVQLTDFEYADRMEIFISDIINADSNRKIETIVDPSAASFIAELRKRKKYKIIGADNAVLDGLRETNSCIKKGYIKFLESKCKDVKNEFYTYVWDDKVQDAEKPVKVNDHAMDACRYFVKTKMILMKAEKKKYKSPFG